MFSLFVFASITIPIVKIVGVTLQEPLEEQPVPVPGINDEPCSPEELGNKEYDILIYGAMSDQGKRAIKYLVGNDESPRLALFASNINMLKYHIGTTYGESAVEIGAFGGDAPGAKNLVNAIRSSRMVVNLVGPVYESSGSEEVIRNCLMHCAHYLDLSTETYWKSSIQQAYGSLAAVRQVAIIQSAGFEAMGSDLLAMYAAKDLVSTGIPAPTHILVIWEVVNSIENDAREKSETYAFMHHGIVNNPYILVPEVPLDLRVDETVDGVSHNHTDMGYNDIFNTTMEPFHQAQVDCPVIRRSMHKIFPNTPMHVKEVSTIDLRPARQKYRETMHHAGHTQNQNSGSFIGKAIAMYKPEQKFRIFADNIVPYAQVVMEGTGNPYDGATLKMALELALGLIFEKEHRVGYLTPSTAVGEHILEQRLTKVDGGNFIKLRHGQ